eukprot:7034768-Prymnesium_polylepis.2
MELGGLQPAAEGGLVFSSAPIAGTNPLHRAPLGRGSTTWYVPTPSAGDREPEIVSNGSSLVGTNAEGTAVLLVRASESGTGQA